MVATATIVTRALQTESLSADADRLIQDVLLNAGVVDVAGDSYKVEETTGAEMKIQVGSGSAGDKAVNRRDGRVYIGEHSNASQEYDIAAADATNDRIDLVVFRTYDDEADSSGNTYSDVEVIQGTPAGSPTVPDTPDGAIALASILVEDNASAITDSDITDLREEVQLRQAALVDSVPVVRARVTAGLQNLGTTEGVHATLNIDIPADWITYDVDIWVSGRVNQNGAAGAADMTLRVRRDTTGGSQVQITIEEVSNAADDTNESFAMVAFEMGRTTTGQITYVFTGQLSAQNALYRLVDKMMVAYAWRTS